MRPGREAASRRERVSELVESRACVFVGAGGRWDRESWVAR